MGKSVELQKCMDSHQLDWAMELPEAAPHSLICAGFSMEKPDAVISSIRKLYEKYIDSSKAMLMVNLSYGTRRSLDDMMRCSGTAMSETMQSNNNVVMCESLMPLLERAVVEICGLMRDTFYRFRRTAEFEAITKIRSMSVWIMYEKISIISLQFM